MVMAHAACGPRPTPTYRLLRMSDGSGLGSEEIVGTRISGLLRSVPFASSSSQALPARLPLSASWSATLLRLGSAADEPRSQAVHPKFDQKLLP